MANLGQLYEDSGDFDAAERRLAELLEATRKT